MINISNINDINNIVAIIFKKSGDLMLTYDYPYVSFLVSLALHYCKYHLSYAPIRGISRIPQWLLLYYQESSNRCSQGRIRTFTRYVLFTVPQGFLNPSVYQFRHLTIYLSFQVVNRDLLCTIQDSHILPYLLRRPGIAPS